MAASPSACAVCGIDKRDHYQRWTQNAGWHGFKQPSQKLIKARMFARRAARRL